MDNVTIIKSALKANVPLLLEGYTGTGKTYRIMELAKEQGKTLHVINVSGELTVDSILGQQTLVDGTVVWRDGVLTNAMKKGDWVLFDELNTALPEVLTVINGVLDDSRAVTLPNADNERVEAHVDFRFVGTQNPANGNYAGTARLNDALLNRMVRVTIEYMAPSEEIAALKKHTKAADGTLTALTDMAYWSRRNLDTHISTRDLVKILRLRDAGKIGIKDATSIVLRDKYSESEYEQLQNRFSTTLYELSRYTDGTSDDPLTYIRNEFENLREERRKLEEEKRNLRESVKSELLRDLLSGKGGSGASSEPWKEEK